MVQLFNKWLLFSLIVAILVLILDFLPALFMEKSVKITDIIALKQRLEEQGLKLDKKKRYKIDHNRKMIIISDNTGGQE